jgi:hypothetical protein
MKKNSKKITAYVNTIRIHWLVEELQKEGIEEIMVTEFFKLTSQISKFKFLCEDESVKNVCSITHKVGTCGNAVDHYLSVNEAENTDSIFPFEQYK